MALGRFKTPPGGLDGGSALSILPDALSFIGFCVDVVNEFVVDSIVLEQLLSLSLRIDRRKLEARLNARHGASDARLGERRMDGRHLSMHAQSGVVKAAVTDPRTAVFEMTAVEARAEVIESLADDLATLDDDAAVAEAKGRKRRLLEANVKIHVRLHGGNGQSCSRRLMAFGLIVFASVFSFCPLRKL